MKTEFEVSDLVRWRTLGSIASTSRGLGIVLEKVQRSSKNVLNFYCFDFTTEEEAPHAYKVHWYGIKKDISLGLLSSNTEWCVTKDLVPA